MHTLPTFISQTEFLEYPSSVVGHEAREIGHWQKLGCPWQKCVIIPRSTFEHIDDPRTIHELRQLYHHDFKNALVTLSSDKVILGLHLNGDANFIQTLKEHRDQGPVLVSSIPISTASGEIYTHHPLLSTHKSQVLVHAYYGTNHNTHNLNIGTVFNIDVRTWQIVGKHHHSQTYQYQPIFEDYKKIKVNNDKKDLPAITDVQAINLARVAYRCKQQQTHHLKLSWQIENGKVTFSKIENWESDHQTTFKAPNLIHHQLLVSGLSLQPGKVTRPAQVIPDTTTLPKTLHIKTGDILVTKKWHSFLSPYLKKVAGLVIEEHVLTPVGLKQIKQFGVPTICRAKAATRLIKNGQNITIHAKPHQTGFVWHSST